MVKGAHKGSSFERWTCQRLSRLADPYGTETHYWRTSQSGGRSTVQRRKGIKNEAQLGDVTCITDHKRAQSLTKLFLIECKHVKSLDLTGSLFKGKGKLHRFWSKLALEASLTDRHPMLIARQNNFGTLLILGYGGFSQLRRSYPHMSYIMSTILAEQTVRIGWFKDLLQQKDFR